MAKTKKDKFNSEQRRQKEVLKAQINSGVRGNFQKVTEAVSSTSEGAAQPKKLSHRLHFREIKKDLIKTTIFAVLVIVFLIILKTQGLELDFGIYK